MRFVLQAVLGAALLLGAVPFSFAEFASCRRAATGETGTGSSMLAACAAVDAIACSQFLYSGCHTTGSAGTFFMSGNNCRVDGRTGVANTVNLAVCGSSASCTESQTYNIQSGTCETKKGCFDWEIYDAVTNSCKPAPECDRGSTIEGTVKVASSGSVPGSVLIGGCFVESVVVGVCSQVVATGETFCEVSGQATGRTGEAVPDSIGTEPVTAPGQVGVDVYADCTTVPPDDPMGLCDPAAVVPVDEETVRRVGDDGTVTDTRYDADGQVLGTTVYFPDGSWRNYGAGAEAGGGIDLCVEHPSVLACQGVEGFTLPTYSVEDEIAAAGSALGDVEAPGAGWWSAEALTTALDIGGGECEIGGLEFDSFGVSFVIPMDATCDVLEYVRTFLAWVFGALTALYVWTVFKEEAGK